MNTKTTTCLGVLLAGLLLAAPALDAQQMRGAPGAPGPRMGPGQAMMIGGGMATIDPVARVLDHAERLELTPEQVERLTRFHMGYLERTAGATATLEAHREGLRETMQEAMHQRMRQTRREEMRERMRDPEARPTPEEMRDRMRERMREPPPRQMREQMRERMQAERSEIEIPPEVRAARQLLQEAQREAMAELESTLTVEQMRRLRPARPGPRGRAPLRGPRR